MFQTNVAVKIKTHFMFNNLSRKSSRFWDNVGKTWYSQTDHRRRMRFGWWITKATDALRICNNYCCSAATMVTRTRLYLNYAWIVNVVNIPCSNSQAEGEISEQAVLQKQHKMSKRLHWYFTCLIQQHIQSVQNSALVSGIVPLSEHKTITIKPVNISGTNTSTASHVAILPAATWTALHLPRFQRYRSLPSAPVGEAAGSSKTSVRFYQTTRRHVLQDIYFTRGLLKKGS
jgi:hypothetical protein